MLRFASLASRRYPSSSSSQQTRSFAADTVYKFSVSPEHLETVKATLPLVGAAGSDLTKHFYARMFKAQPELQNVFNQTNQAIGGQPKKLLKTVAIAAQAAIDTGELPGEAIEGICQKHAALGVGKEAYGIVGTHLLGTISELLSDDKAVLDAWGALYGDIADVFITREEEITSENEQIPNSWSGRRKFYIADKEKLSSMVTRFKFKPVDGKPTPNFKPGSYTTIWTDVGEEEGPYGTFNQQPRHYTLALPRDDDKHDHLSISVKKEGLVSRMLHQSNIGDEYDLSAPYGAFNMSGVEKMWLLEVDTPVIFLSGGVGITPVLAMLENIYATRPATWLHASQNGETHAYRDRLREIAAVRAGELVRRVWYEYPLENDGKPGGEETSPYLYNVAKYHYKGRMDLEEPSVSDDANILHLDNPNAQYFMCGPQRFMEAQRSCLNRHGVADERIHSEGF